VGDTVRFSPQSPIGGGSWSWYGPNGYTATAREVTIQKIPAYREGVYTMVYADKYGCMSTKQITIDIIGAEKTYHNIVNRNSGKSIEVLGASTSDGANVQQRTFAGADHQQWKLQKRDDGFYNLIAKHSEKALKNLSGNIVQATNDSASWSQQFELIPNGSYFQIKNRESGLCVEVAGGSTSDGANIQCAPCNNTYWRQQFNLNYLNVPVKEEQVINFAEFTPKQVGDADFEAGATATSGLPITYSSSDPNVATITESGMVHVIGAGTTNITATQAGNAQYLAAGPVVQQLTVNKLYYVDADGDGFGAKETKLFATEQAPAGYTTNNTDCDDNKLLYADGDGDGLGTGAPAACGVANNTDCDDANPVQLTATIADVYAMNAAVDEKNTLYIGYGPTALPVSVVPAGGTAPYTYQWNSGATTSSIGVAAAGAYTVTIRDAKGCTTTASITISTLDVTCGKNTEKVMICHNGKTICVESADVQEHLDHGCKLGSCPTTAAISLNVDRTTEVNSNHTVVFYPNPVIELLNVKVSKLEAGATIQVYNASGALVLNQRLANATQTISLKGLASGIYNVQVKNGTQITSEKVVKQ
jgi:hypothetical protein